ncbi:MAG: hypothetical protein ACMV0I_06830 [Pseudomonas sp.]
MKIDLSLSNTELYQGCAIEVVAGRANLTTPVAEAVGIVGANIAALVSAVPSSERGTVTLTGPMAVWAYLIVFRAVAATFGEVVYDDGRGQPVVVARRG